VFEDYLRRAKEVGRIAFDDNNPHAVLEKLELLDGEYLLNAGAALFCDTGINELQMAKFASNERLTFTDIRRFTGSILSLAKKAEQYLIDAMDWRVEIGGGLSRKEIPEVPLDAIREAIINSFGHKLMESGESNEVVVFKNRIEIYNPGSFPEGLTPKTFIDGQARPIRRNPLIARTLYYSKDMESFATGLKRIQDACDESGCKVEFDKQLYGFAVVFYRSKEGESVAEENKLDDSNSTTQGITQATTQGTTQAILEELSDLDKQILEVIRSNPKVSQREIANIVGDNHNNIRYSMEQLKKKGVLVREGTSQKGSWVIKI
jgi:ATP-dependent DNA helicase RecG